MSEACGDNRFELIGEFKGELIEGTNIEASPDEMAVLDNILFRVWQMGWLDKLKVQEPRLMTLEEVKALQPDTDIWIEIRYLNAPIRIRACTVSGFSPGGTRLFIIGGAHNYPMDKYNNYFRCWTSRPTDTQREAVKWR